MSLLNRYVRALVGLAGALAIVAGLGVALLVPASGESSTVAITVGLLAFVGVLGALWKVAGSVGDGDDVAPSPWSAAGALADPAPERSRAEQRLSGTGLGEHVDAAGEAARKEGSIEAGLDAIRPELRGALLAALVAGGADEAAAERSLAEGTWTDDRMAASVLDGGVRPPDRPLVRRIGAWLFPERAVVRRTGRAVAAMAAAADDALPTVVGQNAPRSVPVARPTLEDLQRAADGSLQPAVDTRTVVRAPEPVRPDEGSDGETAGERRVNAEAAARDGTAEGDE